MLLPSAPFDFAPLTAGSLLIGSAMFLGFVAMLFIGTAVLPGKRIEGPERGGNTVAYKINGLTLFVLVVAIAAAAQWSTAFSLSLLNHYFFPLFIAANVFSFLISGILYYQGRHSESHSGSFIQGYFYGRTMSPTWLGVNLKLFSYHPSLIGLMLMNVSFAVVQYETYGTLTLAMMLYQAFTFIYVLNYFQFEHGMVHTWDLISERFGWMLVWGDYAFVTFLYCLPGWYLVHATEPLHPAAATAIAALFVFGFVLFRGANEQKHRFKRDPSTKIWGRTVETLDGRLLVSGFWGIGRHLNYTGEICVYFAFVLTTGFQSWVPYILPVFLMCLLVHRSRRDEKRCSAKYGELWDRYKKQARFAMMPFIY